MTEESDSYYWNMCVNETTPNSHKEVVAEKRGFCCMTMTSKVPTLHTTIRFVNWSYTRSHRMKQVSRASYEIYYILYIMKSF